MKKITTSVAFLILAFSIKAQEIQKNSTVQTMGGGGFTIGYGHMDVSKLHVFVPSNIKKFKNDHLLVGGTGHAFIDNFVIGGSGFGIIGDVIKTDSAKINLGGGLGTFDFGYLILNKEKVKIYPMIGIGGAGFGLQIAKNRSISANNIANEPGQEININKGGFVADVSLNLNFIPALQYDEKNNSYGGFMTGLKIGYVYSLPSSDWLFSGGDVTGGPDFGLNMFYLKLVVGGLGYEKK